MIFLIQYLLRDGRPGIQALVELDVYATVPIEGSEAPAMENQYYQVCIHPMPRISSNINLLVE